MKKETFRFFKNNVDANGVKFTTYRLMTGTHHWYDARPRNKDVETAFNKLDSGTIIVATVQRKKVREQQKGDKVYQDTRLYIDSIEEPTAEELETFTAQDNAYNDSTIGEL